MGTPYSRNRGIEIAQCEYTFTGEDDLELSDGFFALLLAHMHDTGADIISGRNIFRFEDESKEESIDRTNKAVGHAVNRKEITVLTGIHTPGDQEQALLPAPMLGRTDLFRKIRWDESYVGNFWREESDFQLSARECGYKLVFCPHAISFNLVIKGDRSGIHSFGVIKRVVYIVKNNWRFTRKHRDLIAQEFDAGNLYLYISTFAAQRVFNEILLSVLISVKRRMRSLITDSSNRASND